MRGAMCAAVIIAVMFSTGCEEKSVYEARPCDIAEQVRKELGMSGVVLSDGGIREAYIRAGELLGGENALDEFDGWAIFLPYRAASAANDNSSGKTTGKPRFSTSFRTAVENEVESRNASEFGVILLSDGDGGDFERQLETLVKARLGEDAEVRRCGDFVLYGYGGVIDRAMRYLFTED